MMSDPNNVTSTLGTRFADVDATEDPQARVNYLDAATAQLAQYKRDSLAALGLEPGMRALDVGCGAGDDARAMAEIVGPTGKVVGLDLSMTMVERARERAAGSDLPVEFVQGSVYELPFPDSSFDASRADRVLQHLDEPLRALQEMVRVTKPGGRIAILDPDWGTELVDTDQPEVLERARFVRQRQRRDEPGDGWRGRQLWNLVSQAGLVDAQVQGIFWCVTDLDVAHQLGDVLDWVRQAHDAGEATSQEVEAWERELRERAAEGRFFAAMGGVSVWGTVPARGIGQVVNNGV